MSKPKIEALSEPVRWTNKDGIAKHLRCSVRHVSDMMKRRMIPYVKRGRFVRFDIKKCDTALKKYEIQSAGHQHFAA